LRVVTPTQHQAYVLNLWKRSQTKIGKWMQGQLILGVIVGVLLYLGLTILGVPNALLLAVLAALFELIPVFGQFLAAIPAVAIGFVDGGVTGALLVAGLYIVVQQFEAHLIYPVVVKKVVGVPPLMVILSLIVGAKLAGFLGILLSVPIAGAIQELVADIDRRKARELAGQGLTPEGEAK
jgi:predicted PurR-regulated permease PerM